MKAISLFASGGIGDLALKANCIDIIIANELLEDRCAVLQHNYPETAIIQGDIRERKDAIIAKAKQLLGKETLDMLYATPPCQGMSKNGRGTILNNIRKGLRPELDERNRLIIPAIEIAKILKPRIVLLENVPEMEDTIIETPSGEYKLIIDYIKEELGDEYVGKAEVVEFANYGVPQKRQRLITVFTREEYLFDYYKTAKTFIPAKTHSASGINGKRRWVTIRDAIKHLPVLDAKQKASATSNIPFHKVPLLDEEKYFWVSNTPSEKGAFDNQCVACGCRENPIHGSSVSIEGINRANTNTPIRCVECNALLPRPWVKEKNGEYRLMKGFTSAYKRMKWDAPANALTTNLSYACSDSKIHPEQNRVLSLYEAFIIHTINEFEYEWKRSDGKLLSDKTIREIIGESIPPKGLSVIVKHLCKLLQKEVPAEQVILENKAKARFSFSKKAPVYSRV